MCLALKGGDDTFPSDTQVSDRRLGGQDYFTDFSRDKPNSNSAEHYLLMTSSAQVKAATVLGRPTVLAARATTW